MVKYIIAFLLLTSSAEANAQQEAIDHIITATYKQTGVEDMVNDLINAKVPREYRENFERVSPIISAIVTNRLDLKWNF